MAKFAKLVWLAAVQIFCFFFHIIKTKREREEKNLKAIFQKEWPKPICMWSCFHWNTIVVVFDQRGTRSIFASWLMLSFCTCTSIRLAGLYVAFSSKPRHIPLPQFLRPQHAMKPGYCQCCFLQSDGQKKKYEWVDYGLQKAPHGHKDVFPVTLLVSTSQAKERSSDRSPVWRSLFCLNLCFKVLEKTSLCLYGAFSMLCELVHKKLKDSFWKGGHTFIFNWLWTTCT